MTSEVRSLLNPAFAASMLSCVAEGYETEGRPGLPLILAFLSPALILHAETRKRLPKVVTSKLPEWAGRNQDLISQLPERINETRAICGQALLIGSTAGLLNIVGGLTITSGRLDQKELIKIGKDSQDLPEIFKKSLFLGRWLSHSGTEATILGLLGVGITHAH